MFLLLVLRVKRAPARIQLKLVKFRTRKQVNSLRLRRQGAKVEFHPLLPGSYAPEYAG
jgi:hypothetical protein